MLIYFRISWELFSRVKTMPMVYSGIPFNFQAGSASRLYTGCIKKTEKICSQRREAAQSMKFLINIDCLGTYDVE